MSILLNKTIRLFLDSIGRRDEYEFYLRKFSADDTAVFAILCPDAEGFEDVAPVLTFDLHSLQQLELLPMVLLAGPSAAQMRDALMQGEHPYELLDGAGKHLSAGEALLADVLEFLRSCRAKGKVGVVCLPDLDTRACLEQFLPRVARRVHFIRPRGALRDAEGEALPFYYTKRHNESRVDKQDQPLIDLAAVLLDAFPSVHLSVASPWDLLRELFTVKGAGCVIRRGSVIHRITNRSKIDWTAMAQLMEDSFRRPLTNARAFDAVTEVYVEEAYRGAALLEAQAYGDYLAKFAVGREARGEGLANELWSDMSADHERLFWRARQDNPINHWYERHADGFHRTQGWRVFWRGIEASHLPDMIAYALDRPDDFAPAR